MIQLQALVDSKQQAEFGWVEHFDAPLVPLVYTIADYGSGGTPRPTQLHLGDNVEITIQELLVNLACLV
jgi:hypothetical protein